MAENLKTKLKIEIFVDFGVFRKNFIKFCQKK